MDIDDFTTTLSKIREDSSMGIAETVDVEVGEGEKAWVEITFRALSGREFTRKFTLPDTWDANDELVVLLDYWDIEPDQLKELPHDERQVPIANEGSGLRIDFDAIYRSFDSVETEIPVEGTDDG
jgi:hypothetical protein